MTYELTGLDGKVAVVTGAGRMRSLGRSIAVELARAGCDVVLTGTGRDPATYPPDEQEAGWRDITQVAEEIQAFGRRALPVVSDVSDPASVEALKQRVLDEFGRVDVLVNNAAASRGPDRVPVLDLDVDVWDHVIKINLRGPFLMTRAFGKVMTEAGGGSIINISSIGGKLGGASSAAYGASKAALQSLTASTSKEFGPSGVRVNALCPGVTGTSRLDDWDQQAQQQYVRSTLPLQRVGKPVEIAHAAVFLASDQAAWVTGQAWNIDGGQLSVH